MNLPTAELHAAFVWDCYDCGHANFERCRHIEPESIEGTEILEEMRAECARQTEELGLTVGGVFLAAPTVVKCSNCGAEFEAETDSEDRGP
jgi:hypothetical protein